MSLIKEALNKTYSDTEAIQLFENKFFHPLSLKEATSALAEEFSDDLIDNKNTTNVKDYDDFCHVVLRRYNESRRKSKMRPLTWNNICCHMAKEAVKECGKSCEIIKNAGIPEYASGYYASMTIHMDDSMTATDIVNAFIDQSIEYKKHIINPYATDFGCAISYNSISWYASIVYRADYNRSLPAHNDNSVQNSKQKTKKLITSLTEDAKENGEKLLPNIISPAKNKQ